jgi:hypothetical protein
MNYTLAEWIAVYVEVQLYGFLVSALVGTIICLGIVLLLQLNKWYRSTKK